MNPIESKVYGSNAGESNFTLTVCQFRYARNYETPDFYLSFFIFQKGIIRIQPLEVTKKLSISQSNYIFLSSIRDVNFDFR